MKEKNKAFKEIHIVLTGDTRVEDPRVPAGHKLVVAGHKPPALGGYDDNLIAAAVRSKLAEILFAKQTLHPDLAVLTGGPDAWSTRHGSLVREP